MELKNYMEIVVENCVNKLLPISGACDCDKCRLDIMSIALNALRPHYVVTETGALYAKMKDFDLQHIIDVTSIVMSAMQKVKESPQH
jgi:competence protein ComFB